MDKLNRKQSPAGGPAHSTTRRSFLGKSCLITGSLLAASVTASSQGHAPGHSPITVTELSGEKSLSTAVLPRLSNGLLRKNIRMIAEGSDELKTLRDAFRIVRQRSVVNAQDPTGHLEQARYHAKHCATDDPQMQVHFSWSFLPWHRAYLYHFEEILKAAVGNSQLTLPYWDWEKDRALPAQFWGDSTNSLYNNTRFVTPQDTLPDEDVDASDPLDAIDFAAFGGELDRSGLLEVGAHAAVHNWVGGDMRRFSTAGRDPIFWLHHANLDRLWDVWLKSSATHANPDDQQWLDRRFTFTNPSGQNVEISVNDAQKMGPGYGEEETVILSNKADAQSIGESPVIIPSVKIPQKIQSKITGADGRRPSARIYLRIDGVRVPTDAPAKIRVFLNQPNAKADTSLKSPAYAGTFNLLQQDEHVGHGNSGSEINIIVDVTDQAREAMKTSAEVSVTLVPVGVDAKRSKTGRVTFKRVSLQVKE